MPPVASSYDKDWIIDSKISKHFSKNQEVFLLLERSTNYISIAMANKKAYIVQGHRDVTLLSYTKEINSLWNILYISKLKQNFLFVGQYIKSNNHILVFKRNKCIFLIKKNLP